MATKRKNFTYDSDADHDIENWIESLPPKKHSYYIRKALKEYINHKEHKDLKQKILQEIKEIKERLEMENNNGKSEEQRQEEIIDATAYIKDVFNEGK